MMIVILVIYDNDYDVNYEDDDDTDVPFIIVASHKIISYIIISTKNRSHHQQLMMLPSLGIHH
jgi:hypothetical protein